MLRYSFELNSGGSRRMQSSEGEKRRSESENEHISLDWQRTTSSFFPVWKSNEMWLSTFFVQPSPSDTSHQLASLVACSMPSEWWETFTGNVKETYKRNALDVVAVTLNNLSLSFSIDVPLHRIRISHSVSRLQSIGSTSSRSSARERTEKCN